MGELARKPGAPTLASSPLELLTPRETDAFNFKDMYLLPFGGAVIGISMGLLYNFMAKRPFYAGVYRQIILGGAGWYCMSVIRDWRFQWRMERDAILRHYISLHPEDFPPYERKRIGELYLKWYPTR